MPPGDCEHCTVLVQLTAEVKRIDEVAKDNFDRLSTSLKDHVVYTKERLEGEMKRIAALRTDDMNNVSTASTTATDTAAGLAKNLVSSEQAGRALVTSTAEAAARRQEDYSSKVESRFGTVDTRFIDLNDARKKTEGREGISIPLMIAIAIGAGALIMWFLKISINLPILK